MCFVPLVETAPATAAAVFVLIAIEALLGTGTLLTLTDVATAAAVVPSP